MLRFPDALIGGRDARLYIGVHFQLALVLSLPAALAHRAACGLAWQSRGCPLWPGCTAVGVMAKYTLALKHPSALIVTVHAVLSWQSGALVAPHMTRSPCLCPRLVAPGLKSGQPSQGCDENGNKWNSLEMKMVVNMCDSFNGQQYQTGF